MGKIIELPGGWKKKIILRQSGATSGRLDVYLFAPDGTKIRYSESIRMINSLVYQYQVHTIDSLTDPIRN